MIFKMKYFMNSLENLRFKNKSKNEKGQTLIIAVIIMVIALAIGITVSSRFISTLRNISESDNSARALAVAEAAIENMLMVPQETLESYINYNNCGNNCVLEISGESNYRARADVTLSFAGSTNDPYSIKVYDGEVYQLSLDGYGSSSNIDVCWDSDASVYASYVYESSGLILNDIFAYNPLGYTGIINGFDEATSLHEHSSCFSVTTTGTPRVLRVKPYNDDSKMYFVPASGQNIPSQGILISSVGRSGDAVKTVQVLKTTGAVPEYFDYVIYQKSLNTPLSNRPD